MMDKIDIDMLDERHKLDIERIYKNMVNARKWADKMPIFRDIILDAKISGNEGHYRYSDKYKDTYFPWGINRSFYDSQKRNMTNNNDAYSGYFWNIYINTLYMYNSHNRYGLNELCKKVDVYYYDVVNTTFYVTDDQIKELLEEINEWYISARDLSRKSLIAEKKEKLKKELSRLEKDES